VLYICFFDDVPNTSGKAIVTKGFGCTIFADDGTTRGTTDTHFTLSKSGSAKMVCHDRL